MRLCVESSCGKGCCPNSSSKPEQQIAPKTSNFVMYTLDRNVSAIAKHLNKTTTWQMLKLMLLSLRNREEVSKRQCGRLVFLHLATHIRLVEREQTLKKKKRYRTEENT